VGFTLFYTVGDGTGLEGSRAAILVGVLTLPTFALALNSFAKWARFGRSSLADSLDSEYVLLARAKGLSEWQVVFRHALRTSLAPIISIVAVDSAVIFGESTVTETVFQWRGMGDFIMTAIKNNDVYSVLAWLVIFGTLVMVLNLIADLLYAVLDPRVRYAHR